jgi:aspartyl-tRNA(Asn)/glutamyl-tRNA(Gln) amidotransferase subunit C
MDATTVKKVAHLARIEINEDNINQYQDDLSNIFSMIDRLEALEIHDIEPLNHPLEMTQRLRQDTVTENDQREQLMQNAPEKADGMFLVPTVIE